MEEVEHTALSRNASSLKHSNGKRSAALTVSSSLKHYEMVHGKNKVANFQGRIAKNVLLWRKYNTDVLKIIRDACLLGSQKCIKNANRAMPKSSVLQYSLGLDGSEELFLAVL